MFVSVSLALAGLGCGGQVSDPGASDAAPPEDAALVPCNDLARLWSQFTAERRACGSDAECISVGWTSSCSCRRVLVSSVSAAGLNRSREAELVELSQRFLDCSEAQPELFPLACEQPSSGATCVAGRCEGRPGICH